jgi:hypothetical protein
MCRNEYFVICFFRTLRNNEISSLLKNSLDTFTNLVKLYADENLFLKQFSFVNWYVNFILMLCDYFFRYLENNALTKLEKDTFKKLTILRIM